LREKKKHGNIKRFPHISSDKKSIIIGPKQSCRILGSPHCTRFFSFQYQSAVHYEVSIKSWLRRAESFLTNFAPRLVKKFTAIERTQSFVTVLKRAHQVSLSWARSSQSTPFQRISSRPISILLSYLSLDFQSVLVPPVFTTKTLYAPSFQPYVQMPRLSHYSWLEYPHNIWWQVQIMNSLFAWLPKFPYYLLTFSLKCLNQDRKENP